ncbi:uncharacterized protein LOC114251723 isoform X3 [Bombyx mandarina]|uniref:Uncharacterized protein LOC114251723 isoform X3 n=1 Tax=Bombyx mandarina TaxID=7092 RepID=A0A6J2KIM1_BOMMA|nr:uncharacterized protein LOC114251723 isoform X3 [Bombyx mandarina]
MYSLRDDDVGGMIESQFIQVIEKYQTKLSKLIKQNILVTTSTISSFKDTLNKININEQQLNNAIDTLMHAQQNSTLLSDNLLQRSKLNEILNVLESSLLTLSFKLQDIINAIMFSKSNILYPSIITPKQLFSELVDNYIFLADYHQFPISLSLDNIYTLMNVSEIATYYNNNKIVFVLKVPLVDSKDYHLYHSIPYPVIISNKTYATIIPSTKYIAITRNRNHYCKLNSLISCKVIYNLNYICENIDAYFSSRSPICESEIISKALNSVPNVCKTNFLGGHLDILQPLSNNRWVFVITEPYKLSIDCQDQPSTEIIIVGTGIVNLPIHCVAFYKDSRLIPKYSKIIKFQPIIVNFNLLNDSCCNSVTLYKTKLPLLNLSNFNLDSITSQQHTINEKPHIVLYGEYYSYTTIIISIIVIIFILALFYNVVKSGTCHRLLKFKTKLNIEKTEELSEVAAVSPSVPKLRTSFS